VYDVKKIIWIGSTVAHQYRKAGKVSWGPYSRPVSTVTGINEKGEVEVEFTLDSCPKCKDKDEDFKCTSCQGSGHYRQWLSPKKYEVTPKENWGLWAKVKGANNAAWNTILDKDDSTLTRVGKVGGAAVVGGLAAAAAVTVATSSSIGAGVTAIGNATAGAAEAVAGAVTKAGGKVVSGVTGAGNWVAGKLGTYPRMQLGSA